MPDRPETAVEHALRELDIDCLERDAYFMRLLAGVLGWASQARRAAWVEDRDDPGAVRDLLAARVCQDLAISRLACSESPCSGSSPFPPAFIEDERTRLVLLEAAEDRFARRTFDAIDAAETDRIEPPARPAAQLLFCIDVRSEPMRRHLERLDTEIETIGFAGFFGMPIAWRGAAGVTPRCPALLRPQHVLGGGPAPHSASSGWHDTITRLVSAPGSSFAMMELGGPAWLGGLLRDLAARASRRRADEHEPIDLDGGPAGGGMGFDERVALAAGLLRGACLLERPAPLVVLCGHASCSANNPHAAGLDCGACGGGGGGANARVGCTILNDPRVRAALRDQGIVVPDDTRFVAAVHDTSDDTVRVLDRDRVPASHESALRRIETLLDRAGARVRAERAPDLGLDPDLDDRGRLRALRRRARDWAEVRTEWGLAGNAAFIVGPRRHTRGTDLGGRCFLHEYDPVADVDGSVLEGILAAPVVVASWINLQYLGATVDPEVLGGGDKTVHDRIGSLGVAIGAGGDLGRGLPRQSVHDEQGGWRHDPLRLQVMITAPRDRIEAVLERRSEVRMLVENGWIRILATDPRTAAAARLVPGEGWEPVVRPGDSLRRNSGARPCPTADVSSRPVSRPASPPAC
jgi:uncharacterized protein YbcC (UPF0753/DUF2309 family)